MKFLKKINLILWVLALSAIYMSCTKETPHIAPRNTDLSNSATVQVFSATVKAPGIIFTLMVPQFQELH
jgi:hypothetical protein